MREICTCCGRGGRGLLEELPHIWTGCDCLCIRRCERCSLCYGHCQCTPPELRLEELGRESQELWASIDEAWRLADALGVDEIHGKLNEDTMWKIEQLLQARYRAFKRFRRRVDRLTDVDMNRRSVERALSKSIITVESDLPH